ncbi:MAG: NUDIX hydrolase [Candidatus Aenigmarchaeota archaeon]|nr:NUDIX hydrolase [Candidatus Aenigmarchaeota archaeon]
MKASGDAFQFKAAFNLRDLGCHMDWNKFDRGVFLVNCLAVIYNPKTKKILIGKRENDPNIRKLGWCFPGGRPGYEKDIEYYLQKEVEKKTGLRIGRGKVVFAKTYPEKREILSIYYYVTMDSGEAKPGEKFTEVKWIKPTEVKKYFTTSLHPEVFKFLKTLR